MDVLHYSFAIKQCDKLFPCYYFSIPNLFFEKKKKKIFTNDLRKQKPIRFMSNSTERDYFSESFEKVKFFEEEIKAKIFGPRKSKEEKEEFVFEPLQSIDVLKERILESSQRTWRLDDFEKKCFRSLDYSYSRPPGETFYDFYKKLLYSVHPEIQEKKEFAKNLKWSEIRQMNREFQKQKLEYLFQKYNKQKKSDEAAQGKEEVKEEYGSFMSDEDTKQEEEVVYNKAFDRAYEFKRFKRVPITNKELIELKGRDFEVEIYKDTMEDIDPLFATYPKHGSGYIDLFLHKLEKFELWQTTRLFSMGFICSFPILVGMVLARQVPKNLGTGDVFKVLKSKMVYKGGFNNDITRREAGLILGVKQNATKEEIRSRHRKLMILNHPDNGGSQFIAAKINESKEVMLKGDI